MYLQVRLPKHEVMLALFLAFHENVSQSSSIPAPHHQITDLIRMLTAIPN